MMDEPTDWVKVGYELSMNQGLLHFWPDDVLYRFINPLYNLCYLQIALFWFLGALPRMFRITKLESRRYFRRKLIGNILSVAPEYRESLIRHLWIDMQKNTYLQNTGHVFSNYRNKLHRYIHHYEIVALRELIEAEDMNRTLLLLGFIDASRLGSQNSPELHQHLTSVLTAWEHASVVPSFRTMNERIKYGMKHGWFDDKESVGERSFEEASEDKKSLTEKFAPELGLIERGEEGRRIASKECYKSWDFGIIWLLTDRVDGPDSKSRGSDNLDFAEFGPSIARLRKIVKSKNTRQWEGANHRGQYIGLWFFHFLCGFMVLSKLLVLWTALNGCYPLTINDQPGCLWPIEAELNSFNRFILWLEYHLR